MLRGVHIFTSMENVLDTTTIDIDQLYEQAKERAISQSAYSQEEWDTVIDEMLDSKREFEETGEDVDWEDIREVLQSRFDEFETEIPEM